MACCSSAPRSLLSGFVFTREQRKGWGVPFPHDALVSVYILRTRILGSTDSSTFVCGNDAAEGKLLVCPMCYDVIALLPRVHGAFYRVCGSTFKIEMKRC